ncbi:polysaccharide biosynthesis protein [Candidatus Uhrbacteria bacterium]|nr:polysaccharide biosynthesis protein [Candidatus Uhrbacteria bacterium]
MTLLLPSTLVRRVLQPTRGKRVAFFILADAWVVTFALVAAFFIRFDFAPESPYAALVLPTLPLFLLAQIGALAFFGGYGMSWRFVSLRDLANILNAVIAASLALAFALYFLRLEAFVGFPRGVLLIDAVLVFVLIAALRIGKRAAMEVLRGQRQAGRGRRTIIIGAGNTGEMVLRDMQRTQYDVFAPVAFLDDDERLLGTRLHGVRVRGAIRHLKDTIRSLRVEVVIVAIQSLGHQDLRRIYQATKEAGITEVKIVPRLYDVHAPQIRLQAIEDIKIEDLIRREVVHVDTVSIRRVIAGKAVLITGAAGSIGSEIVRQICRYGPRSLVCFEIDETELHRLQLTLRREFPTMVDRVRFVVGDIRDTDRVDEVFERCRPEVVFHAAAYKHVPMMEENVSEAVKVNVVGTWNVAETARRVGVERFVLISTDKAVRPTSVMGATKRIAEQLCRACGEDSSTAFLSVRFGNVLGSRGSVLPIFMEQLARGGPLTVTHEEMRRYFMTIPEAVSLVLQAGAIGRSGEVLVFDMGDPVHILTLAEELIRLHNLRPHTDIAIEYIGIRPGEKLFEELLTAEEGTTAAAHEKLYIARSPEQTTRMAMHEVVQQFAQLARFPDADGNAIRQLLRQRVRWYEPNATERIAGAPARIERTEQRVRQLAT